MNVHRTINGLRQALEPLRQGRTIGLVPTMGALHRGHVRLFERARGECDLVVASLFVNPHQFGDQADLGAYPRDEAGDAAAAAKAGVDFLFVPSVAEIYPDGYSTWVEMGGPARGLEGEFRPGHFRGVATVCLKLFLIVRPTVAYLGQKDAQQVAVVKQLVRDLHVDLEIRVVPTVRDHDGLALSSRNAQLLPTEREQALAIVRALEAGATAARRGEDAVAAARAQLGGLQTEYVEVAVMDGRPTLLIAARVGATRLIDNIWLDDDEISRHRMTAVASGPAKGDGE